MATINASSPSRDDVNFAINGGGPDSLGNSFSPINRGDTLVIPAGTSTWTSQLSCSKCITIRGTYKLLSGVTVNPATDVFTRAGHLLSDGDIIDISTEGEGELPAGTSDIVSYYVINSTTDTFKTSLTLGGSSINVTDPGSGALFVTRYDTTIKDGMNNTTSLMNFPLNNALNANLAFELAGLNLEDAGRPGWPTVIAITSTNVDNRKIRMHHCRSTLHGFAPFFYTVVGIIDHCRIISSGKIPMYCWTDNWNGVPNSDGAWADPPMFGTDKFLFLEDNTIYLPNLYATMDAYRGARYVGRYNRVYNGWWEMHGSETGRPRGTRAVEIYKNKHFATKPVSTRVFMNCRSGTLLAHDNKFINYDRSPLIFLDIYGVNWPLGWGQHDGTDIWDVNEPGGPFDNGSITSAGAGNSNASCIVTDNTKNWTANRWKGYHIKKVSGTFQTQRAWHILSNTANTITGYWDGSHAQGPYGTPIIWVVGDNYQIWKCNKAIDQPARGQGTQLSGGNPYPPLPIGWNNQVPEPCYEWNNTGISGVTFSTGYPGQIKENEDYFKGTPMPGYVPFPYPHYLAAGSAAPITKLISFSGNLAFNDTQVGSTNQLAITVTNSGNADLTISNVTDDLPGNVLTYSPTGNQTVSANGGQKVFTFTFAPANAVSYSGTASFISDATSGSGSLQVAGAGIPAPVPITKIISLSGDLQFGDVNIGDTAIRELTITNNGSAALNVNAITVPTGYFASWTSGPVGANGGQQSVNVQFSPTSQANYNGALTVSSDKTSGINTVQVYGNAVQPPGPNVPAPMFLKVE